MFVAFAGAVPIGRSVTTIQNACNRSRTRVTATMAPVATPVLKKRTLGSSELLVTEVCLGTMTWGVQNTEIDAHQQLDYAIKERGVNFIDTAELYPVPPSAPEYVPGVTETYIGSWFAKNPEWRSRIVLASKVMGYVPASAVAANRTVPPTHPKPDGRLDAKSIVQACEGSLRRLQTSYIDLYQLHWPDRYVPIMGGRIYDPSQERPTVSFKDTLRGLKQLLDEGKIRAWGVSNETTYGVCELVRAADELGIPRPATIQNQFCLLNRAFEGELAEACAPGNYNIGLLPWSVLGGGALTGKYSAEKQDPNTRFNRYKNFQKRFHLPRNLAIIEKYREIADEAGVSLATLAQAWCATRWFIPSTIIGATTVQQLEENINAFGVKLSDTTLRKIDAVHDSCKDPYILGFPTGKWDPRGHK